MDVPAYEASQVIGASVSNDGKQIILHFRDGAKNPFTVAVSEQQILSLLAAASHSAGQAQKILRQDNRVRFVFACERWAVFMDRDPKQEQKLIFSFRIPGGIWLSFRIHLGQLPHMIASLQAMAGIAPLPPPGTVKQ